MLLSKISTSPPDHVSKNEIKKENKQLLEQVIYLQKMLQANGKHGLLIILQGMDAAGKTGATKALSGINPGGIKVHSFKKPTPEEIAHDFLWRIHQKVPKKGMIHFFDRSHYEDILVPSVEGYVPKKIIEKRYEHINQFEQILMDNGIGIIKLYLHVSKTEQESRLLERITNPEKHWKHNDRDWKVREYWEKYMAVYQEIFKRCAVAPWQIIPSDKNWYKKHKVLKAVIKSLEQMQLSWPKLQTQNPKFMDLQAKSQ